MKNLLQKITGLCLLAAAMVYSTGASAQCTFNNDIYLTWDASTQLVAVSDQVSSTCTFAGEMNRVTNMVAGNTYRISTCTNTAFDTQITIYTAGGGTTVGYADDDCGVQSEIYFTPSTSGDYDIQINEFNCLTNTTCMDMVVELTAIGGGVGCTSSGSQWPTSTLTPTTSWQVASTIIYGGDYSLYNVTTGTVYEWSLCAADGGAASYDSELTLFNNAILATGLAYADDVCGDDAKITWTATFTGVARIKVNQFNCATNTTNSTLVYRSVGPVPPVNDECSGAYALSTATSCSPVTGTTENATQSIPAISCDGFTSGASLDVWYSFTADNTTATVTVVGSSDFDPVVEVLSGTCGAQSNVDCADATVTAGTETVSLTGLTIGNTYYIRVYDYGTTLSTSFTFDICVVSTPAGPANDNCAGAITLTVGTNGDCNPILGTVASATASPNASCGTGTPDDDVWYKFVVSSPTAILDVLGGTGFDAVVEAFVGTDCNALTSIGCIDGSLSGELESIEATGLTIGTTLWLRVYDYYSGVPTGTDFTICVFNPCAVTPPVGYIAETETCGADANGGCNMVTPAYQDITCGQSVLGTMWADTNIRDTDWYRFTVTSSTTVTWTASGELPFAIALLDISNCATPTVLSNGGSITTASGCATATASATLTPGTYVAFVAPNDYNYYVCSGGLYNEYWATLTMTTTTPTVTPGGATTFCQGGSVTLTSSSTTGNVWSPDGATTQAISATASGSYTVTVQDPNGCGPLTSSSVSVTVNPLPATPTITPGGPTTFCDPGSVTLTSSSASGYLWSPGGATTQSITADADGSFTVTVTDGNGCVSAASAATVVDEEICIGVNESAMVNSLNIFPNPAADNLNIEFTSNEATSLEVRMTNTLGQLVYSDVKTAFSGTYKNTFSVSGFATGNYNLQVITDKEMMNKKVIIK
ncbi:MAG: T9SS type A sorting domain-containing protein [Bacteroidia bacterium]